MPKLQRKRNFNPSRDYLQLAIAIYIMEGGQITVVPYQGDKDHSESSESNESDDFLLDEW